MKKLSTDWHIHTEDSCDSACLRMADLVAEQKQNGITDYGVTDHLHTLLQEDAIRRSRAAYDAQMALHPELQGHFHFGVEASVMSQWQVDKMARGEFPVPPVYGYRDGAPADAKMHIAVDAEFREKYGIEFVVTGVHWPLYEMYGKEVVAKEYFRQYLFAAAHPQTDILAHFLWWNSTVRDAETNPFLDFSIISEQMRGELKAALLENHTAFELNIGAILLAPFPKTFLDEYMGWCGDLQRSGVVLSVGSDTHAAHTSLADYEKTDALLEHYGIDREKLWCL